MKLLERLLQVPFFTVADAEKQDVPRHALAYLVKRGTKEILYSIDLHKQDFLPQPNVRLSTDTDYIQWKPLRLNYLIEEGIPNDLNDKQLLDLFLNKTKKKTTWGLFLNNTLVSIAECQALDLGQVGSVYTMPSFRQRGSSKSVMKQLLLDAKELHKIRKLIIFTGDKNFPAQKLYNCPEVSQIRLVITY